MRNEKRRQVVPEGSHPPEPADGFEKNLKRLEDIVTAMESGQTRLDETIALYEEGLKLVNFCQSKLTEVQHKVEILDKNHKPKAFEPEKNQ
ncbi:MAG: exodeoxyribonuclease VII small subunit [Elusimicrobia bacterium]|nr:exodeoxyribonuclease VII small subunit [Elusimicrobiota bacterium]